MRLPDINPDVLPDITHEATWYQVKKITHTTEVLRRPCYIVQVVRKSLPGEMPRSPLPSLLRREVVVGFVFFKGRWLVGLLVDACYKLGINFQWKLYTYKGWGTIVPINREERKRHKLQEELMLDCIIVVCIWQEGIVQLRITSTWRLQTENSKRLF